VSIREAARRVERDVKAVHGDVTALFNTGILSKADEGMIVFPYDAIQVDFPGLTSGLIKSGSAEPCPPCAIKKQRSS